MNLLNKKLKIIFNILLCLAFFSLPSFSNVFDFPVNAKNLPAFSESISDIKCKFKQEKYLKGVSKPIVSGGDFEFISNKGVYFHTKYPIESVSDYTDKNNKYINDIINAISNKRYSKIEKNFYLFFSQEGENRSLGIKPKEESAAFKYISSITMEANSDFVNKIVIEQKNGSKTVLWFEK